MSRYLRTRSLLSAAALVLILTAAADAFGQSSGATADVSNSASPKNTAPSGPTVSTSGDKASQGLPRNVGNYPIIVPSKLTSVTETNKAANKPGGDNNDANSNSANNSTPPPIPPPSPQGQLSQFSDRTFSRARNAPQQLNLTAIKIIDHVNGLIGGFDQGAGFGFGLELTTSKGADLKGYEFYARAIGSSRGYRSGELGARVGNNNTRGEVWFNYTRRTRDNFFGIGPLIPDTAETNYDTERRSYNGLFAHRFSPRLEAGLYGSFSSTGSFRGEDDKEIPIDTLFSGNPNVVPITSFLPGFQQNARLVSYGVFAELDLRNNESGLTKGGYFYGRLASVDGVDTDNAFSDFGWIETELDGRAYIPILSNKTSLALRGYAVLREPKGGSQIPFYDLAFFGGRSFGRGFKSYRFRGNNSVLFSGEVRQTIWSQNDENTRGLDIIAFAEVGQVWGDNRSKTNPIILANDDFDTRNYRTGFGGGFQYRLNKTVAFRIEVGASNERTLGYLSLRPGF